MSEAVFYSQTECDSFYNMACDEWMFQQVCNHPEKLYLRLYGWATPTITFGVNQRQEQALDFSQLDSTPVIRRMTGGRALYHDRSELTYSVAANLNGWDAHSWAKTFSSLFRVLAEGFTELVSAMGKPADYCRSSTHSNSRPDFFHRAPCFASRARYEIVSDKKKVVASAARKHNDAVLQHGSIKLAGIASHPALSIIDPESMSHSVVLQPISNDEKQRADSMFREIMAKHLGVDIKVGVFSNNELEKHDDLARVIKQSPLGRRFFLHNKGE